MITTVPSLCLTMADFDVCLVKVLDVMCKVGPKKIYKEIRVQEEFGWWMRVFYFNIFEFNDMFENIEPGMKLQVKVSIPDIVIYL